MHDRKIEFLYALIAKSIFHEHHDGTYATYATNNFSDQCGERIKGIIHDFFHHCLGILVGIAHINNWCVTGFNPTTLGSEGHRYSKILLRLSTLPLHRKV